MAPTVAVIGSGLAGLSAAYELSNAFKNELPQAKVVIFEKNSILGGNSAKASSGINAVNAAAGDSTAAYAADTNKSGGGFSTQELVDTLAVSAVAALQACFRLLRGGGVSMHHRWAVLPQDALGRARLQRSIGILQCAAT
jgi:succinate dehydrogenase/fumarate reductase flavoprotein subunit